MTNGHNGHIRRSLLALCIRKLLVQISARLLSLLSDTFHYFPQSLYRYILTQTVTVSFSILTYCTLMITLSSHSTLQDLDYHSDIEPEASGPLIPVPTIGHDHYSSHIRRIARRKIRHKYRAIQKEGNTFTCL
jgi:hypothetical protein